MLKMLDCTMIGSVNIYGNSMKIRYLNKIMIYIRAFWDYLIINYFLNIPSHLIRRYIVKRKINHLGLNTWFLIGVKFRNWKNISIGDNCAINSGVLLDGRGGKIIVGKNVDIAQEVNIWTLQHDPHSDFHTASGGDVEISDNVWIASRVTILPGIRIGEGAVLACGSVVTRDVPPRAIMAGIPAKNIGKRKSKIQYKINYRPPFR